MEDHTPREIGQPRQPAFGRRELLALAVLLVVAASIRVWVFCHTEVASRDSISFIRIAWHLRHGTSWTEAVRQAEHHAGYPFLIMLASYPVDWLYHGPEPVAMQFAAQLASGVAGTLLVLPMYFLARRLFDPRTAFWGCLLFQCLPTGGRILSDGLSEASYLLWATTALWLAVIALERRSPLLYALCGVFGALAYLTRPEGVLTVLSAGFVLLAVQFLPEWRRSWRRTLSCLGALVLTAVVTASPYNLAIRGFTVKPVAGGVLGGEESVPGKPRPMLTPPIAGAAVFADWIDPERHESRLWWGAKALANQLMKGLFYVVWIPALAGLWLHRGRMRSSPAGWVVGVFCGVFLLLLWRVAAKAGYLSDRHCLILVQFGCLWAAYAGQAFLAALPRVLPASLAASPVLALTLLLALPLAGLTRTLAPLHDERSGFKQVGFWLAENTGPSDFVLDPYSWANYYAGRVFTDPSIHPTPRPGCRWFIVLEDAENPHPRLGWHRMAVRTVQQTDAAIVHRQPVRRDKGSGQVVVYSIYMPPRP